MRAVGIAVCCAAISLGASAGRAHPLHTTLVQLTYDERTQVAEASIRVFAGDFAAAVAKHAGAKTPEDDRVADAAAFAYVSSTVRFTDAAGHPLALAWCGSRRTNDCCGCACAHRTSHR